MGEVLFPNRNGVKRERFPNRNGVRGYPPVP